MIPILLQKVLGGKKSLKRKLVQAALGSFGLRVTAVGLKFFLSLILARTIGAEGLGAYTFAITSVSLLSIPASLGFPQLAVREIAIYQANNDWQKLKGFIRQSSIIVFIFSVFIVIASLFLSKYFISANLLISTFRISLISLPFIALRSLNQSAIHGLGKIIQSQIAESLLFPATVIISIAVIKFIPDLKISAEKAALIYVFSGFIAFFLSNLLLKKNVGNRIKNIIPKYQLKKWVFAAIPFVFFGGLYIINSQLDIMMLGSLKNAQSVGIYAISNRLASLMVFVLIATNSSLAPNIAKLNHLGEISKLEKIISKSTRVVFIFSCVIALLLLLAGKAILNIFGSDFIVGYTAVLILGFGQLFNAAVGPVNLILNMTGNEKFVLKSLGVSAIFNIIGNVFLIPSLGVNGAAISTSFSMIIWNVSSTIFVIRNNKLNPTIITII